MARSTPAPSPVLNCHLEVSDWFKSSYIGRAIWYLGTFNDSTSGNSTPIKTVKNRRNVTAYPHALVSLPCRFTDIPSILYVPYRVYKVTLCSTYHHLNQLVRSNKASRIAEGMQKTLTKLSVKANRNALLVMSQ